MTTDILTILETVVDGAGLMICLASVALIIRSQRLHRRQMTRRRHLTDNFHRLLDTRRVGQAAESAFSAILDAVEGHRQRFMAAIDDPAPESATAAGHIRSASQTVAAPDDRRPPEVDNGYAPATLSLARKIRQRQQERLTEAEKTAAHC